MANVDEVLAGGLGDINVGASAMVAFINPLAAQLDASIAFALGPLQADISASLDASIALSASLALSVSNPLANLQAALSAVVGLQAAIAAALTLPPIALSLSAEISAAAALTAALTAKLGLIDLLIQAAIDIKIPAVRAAADLAASLSTGGVVLFSWDGLGGSPTLSDVGNQIQTAFQNPIGVPPTPGGIPGGVVQPTDGVAGVLLVGKTPGLNASFQALFAI